MSTPHVFDSEYLLATIVWDNEPMSTRELVEICSRKHGWKRTTTYTQLKRLCERGVLQMENSIVSSRISREEIQLSESRSFLQRTFSGSLSSMVQAFTGGQALSKSEADEIRKLIDRYEEKL